MSKTRQVMVSDVRLLIQDTDTGVATDFLDAQITTFINYALMWWYENNEKRIKYVTLKATLGNGEDAFDGDATCLYPEILECSLAGAEGTEDVPLGRMDWSELRYRQNADALGGTPTHFAALKYGGAAVGASAQNKWKFALWPVQSSGVLRGVVRDYPVALSADADIVDLGLFEANCVCIIAAMFLAPRKGRPDLAADLEKMLPQMVRDKLTTHAMRDEIRS